MFPPKLDKYDIANLTALFEQNSVYLTKTELSTLNLVENAVKDVQLIERVRGGGARCVSNEFAEYLAQKYHNKLF